MAISQTQRLIAGSELSRYFKPLILQKREQTQISVFNSVTELLNVKNKDMHPSPLGAFHHTTTTLCL